MRTSNLARESALSADFPLHVPASTVTMACISSNAAVASMASAINAGQMEAAVAGGAETMSDVPIRFSREMRKRMLGAQKGIRSLGDAAKFLRGFKLSYLLPELPAIAEFSTGEVMGHSSDRLAATWGVGRAEQDDFAHRSHRLAAAAARDGLLAEEIVPVGAVTADNGIKGDAPREKLATLAPAFVKPHGTHTAANSSFLTDGASAALLMSEARARADGYAPKSRIVDWLFVGADPRDELLLGPAYAITRLLARNRLAARDVDVWEIHEAFAGQVRQGGVGAQGASREPRAAAAPSHHAAAPLCSLSLAGPRQPARARQRRVCDGQGGAAVERQGGRARHGARQCVGRLARHRPPLWRHGRAHPDDGVQPPRQGRRPLRRARGVRRGRPGARHARRAIRREPRRQVTRRRAHGSARNTLPRQFTHHARTHNVRCRTHIGARRHARARWLSLTTGGGWWTKALSYP